MLEPSVSLLAGGSIVMIAEQERRIVRRAGTDQRPIVKLEGCEDRAAAAALTGAEVLVARDAAPELEQDEWWPEDLEGCAVSDGDQAVGVVRRVLALPSCEVLEVARPEGGELLVPLVQDAVREVDAESGRIDVDLEFLGER